MLTDTDANAVISEMEAQAAEHSPGVLDVLAVYQGIEATYDMVESYLAAASDPQIMTSAINAGE